MEENRNSRDVKIEFFLISPKTLCKMIQVYSRLGFYWLKMQTLGVRLKMKGRRLARIRKKMENVNTK